MAEAAEAPAYDPENIFAKIIEGKVPCFKVFESKASLAYLDAFPMVEGHTLLIPKAKGSTSLLDMPPAKASEFMRDLQKVAKAVQKATGATGINIWQNNGADAGQTVFHPHFHIVPRTKDDKLMTYPASAKAMISKDVADPMVAKIVEALNPPKPLKKPNFGGKLSKLNPTSKGMNFKVKLLAAPKEVEASKGSKFFEVLAGDESGSVILSLRDDQAKGMAEGKSYIIQNSAVKMVKGHIRLTADKWGKIESTDEEVEGAGVGTGKNVSETEYELVGK